MKEKDISKISILIIPGTQKVRRLSIPHWLPKATVGFLALSLISLTVYFKMSLNYQSSLLQDANEKLSIINSLEEENRDKDKKLNSLKSENNHLYEKTEEVEDKLTEIDKLQRRLEKMAGIDSPSRGGGINRDVEMDLTNHAEEMNVIAEVLEDKKLELEIFIEDLEAQFDYLDSVPDLRPTVGRVTSRFGNRRDPFTKRIQFHQGVDLANSTGTSVKAAAKGTVVFAGVNGAYGRTVILDHGYGYKTLYAHNSKILVKVGDKVEKGQEISKMGSSGRSTGSHLHFEIHIDNVVTNPLELIPN
ncbi:MAG: peptidoglycan DD-metalloendopeptidase family protein [Tissierellaceae bacterium]|nr:peptidoglycan DD-metalloendopeptidase family protein [Tissierellaceae bacterium]